jgi:RND family efflux transporter MFP subunit
MKRPTIAVIAVLCLVGLVLLFRALFMPRQVQTGQVTRGDLITVVYATGRVSADSLATLRSKSGGIVRDAVRREGVRVTKGAILLRTEAGDQELGVRSARNAVASAEVHLRTRERELRQQEALFQSHSATRTAVDDARKEFDLARITVEKERNNLGLAEQKLSDTEVRAPFAGIVISATASIGDLLPVTAEWYQLLAPGSLMLSADVAEQDIARLKPGQPGIVAFDAYPQRRWKGTVSRIVPRTDEATKTSRVILRL